MDNPTVQAILDYVQARDTLHYLSMHLENPKRANFYLGSNMRHSGVRVNGQNWTEDYNTAFKLLFKNLLVSLTLDHIAYLKDNEQVSQVPVTLDSVKEFIGNLVLTAASKVQVAYMYLIGLDMISKLDVYQAVIDQLEGLEGILE